MASLTSLCEKCSEIDFHEVFQTGQGRGYIPGGPLGWLSEIRQKEDKCAFCRMVMHILHVDGIDKLISEKGMWYGRVLCSIRLVDFGAFMDDASQAVRTIRRVAMDFYVHNLYSWPSVHQIQLLGDDVSAEDLDVWVASRRSCGGGEIDLRDLKVWDGKSNPRNLYHGRLVDSKVDLKLISSWLDRCVNEHTNTCAIVHDAEREDFPTGLWNTDYPLGKGFRVIDVQRMKVVSAPKDCKFVALSYQWGSLSMLRTMRVNFEQLSKDNGIREEALPESVLDAIFLCRNIGQAYLWVDALCIIQDDDDDREIQISNMQSVYTRAEFTIGAAGGNDANAGLKGVRSERELVQNVAKVDGLRLITALPSFTAEINNSRWNTRGWTFQERILSPRMLVFTEGQMFFICQRRIWYEDAKLEANSLKVGPDAAEMPLMLHAPMSRESFTGFSIYMELVSQYTKRNLSYPDDILNAFSGIVQRLMFFPDLGGRWHYGMPEHKIMESLFWMPIDQPVFCRRVGAKSSAGKTQQPEPLVSESSAHDSSWSYPSWSWAGWTGAVKYSDPTKENLSTIDCHISWDGRESRSVNIPIIRARTLKLWINPDCKTKRGTPFGIYSIQNSKGKKVPEILLDRRWASETPKIGLDFICLLNYEQFHPPSYSSGSIHSAITDHDGLYLNSMLVEKIPHSPNGIVSRVGIAHIPQELWDGSDVTWTDTKLG